MKYVLLIGSIIFGVVGFASMATIGAGPKIDYKTATKEERQEWMDGQAKVIKTAAKYFLPSGQGPSSLNFYLRDVITRPDASEMEMLIDVKVPYGAKVQSIPKSKFLDTFCKSYIETALYKQSITLIAHFRNQSKKKRIARINVHPSDCRWLEKKQKNS